MDSVVGHHQHRDLVLTPQQRSLIYAACVSQPNLSPTIPPMPAGLHMTPAFGPVQHPEVNRFEPSPLIKYDYDFSGVDNSFDFGFVDGANQAHDPNIIGDVPGSGASDRSGSDINDTEKRSHPDDDMDGVGGAAKRQETGEKVSKKPGRKPLTTEPTSKRKAQNRAAQRAFRERKEQHLKNLETKVEQLEEASARTDKENSVLRAQIEQMTAELGEYKKRFSLFTNHRPSMPADLRPSFGSAAMKNLNDVNFQFELPKFGQLPGPTPTGQSSTNGRSSSLSRSPSHNLRTGSRTGSHQVTAAHLARHNSTGSHSTHRSSPDHPTNQVLADLSAIFSPPVTNNNVASAGHSHRGSPSGPGTTTSSPPASPNSKGDPISSCGTSPEPLTHSPGGFKPVDSLGTGQEKQPLVSIRQDIGHFPYDGMTDMTFMSSNNQFEFDPQLFGEYRESQENVLGGGFDDPFFSEAFDFTNPYFAPSPPKKEDLISRIEAARNDDDKTEFVADSNGLLTCNTIWERLQNCPKVQSRDFDLDGLCSDLQKKARCNGSASVVEESDFKQVMRKYLGKAGPDDDGVGCPGERLLLPEQQPLRAPA